MSRSEDHVDDVRLTPPGIRFTMLFASYLKRAAERPNVSDADRLWILETLGMLSGSAFRTLQLGETVIQALAPMSDVEAEMMHTALALDEGSGRCENACKLVESPEVYEKFVALNPSLVKASKLYHGGNTYGR